MEEMCGRALGGLSKMAANWLQDQPITKNGLLDSVLLFRSLHGPYLELVENLMHMQPFIVKNIDTLTINS